MAEHVRPIGERDTKAGTGKLYGPMYTGPGMNLGPEPVQPPKGGKSVPDPIGLKKPAR